MIVMEDVLLLLGWWVIVDAEVRAQKLLTLSFEKFEKLEIYINFTNILQTFEYIQAGATRRVKETQDTWVYIHST